MGLSLLAHGAAALTAGTIVHLRGWAAVAPAPARLASQVALTEIELVPAPTLPVAPAEAGDEGTVAQPEIPRPATPARRRSAGPAFTRAQASGPTATPAAPISETAGPAPAAPLEEGESAPARFALVVGTIGNVAVAAAPSSGRGAKLSPTASGAAGDDVGPGEGVVPEREVTERARLVWSGPLVYPAAARRAELEADVALEIVVGLDGRVVSARVRQPAGYGLDEEAVRAVGAYRFSPARRDGRPVRVHMPWTVQFRLR